MTNKAHNIYKALYDYHCVRACTQKHTLTKHTLMCHETINIAEKQKRTKHLMKLYAEAQKNYISHMSQIGLKIKTTMSNSL